MAEPVNAAPTTTETATPAPVTTEKPAPVATPAGAPGPANDNAQPAAPTDADVLALVEKYGPDKALQLLTRKLNYTLDGQVVTVAERAAFREEKRQAKKRIEDAERDLTSKLDARVKESESEIALGQALKRAHASGDYDGVAKALGVENWNALQEDFIKRLADPNHQRLIELEKREQERERTTREQQEQYQQQQRRAQKEALVQQYKTGMSEEMKQSENPFLREMHSFPDVINMLYTVQNEHFDGKKTITLEDAMNRPLPGGRVPVREIFRQWHEALGRAFKEGEPAPTLAETIAEQPKAKGKTEPAPSVAPSAARSFKSGSEWSKEAGNRLKAAMEQDSLREAEERRKGKSQAAS